MQQNPLESQTRLAHYYAAHPELHHADRADERGGWHPRAASARPSLLARARRSYARAQYAAVAARRAWVVSGRASL